MRTAHWMDWLVGTPPEGPMGRRGDCKAGWEVTPPTGLLFSGGLWHHLAAILHPTPRIAAGLSIWAYLAGASRQNPTESHVRIPAELFG